jgi:hypothetical protein
MVHKERESSPLLIYVLLHPVVRLNHYVFAVLDQGKIEAVQYAMCAVLTLFVYGYVPYLKIDFGFRSCLS